MFSDNVMHQCFRDVYFECPLAYYELMHYVFTWYMFKYALRAWGLFFLTNSKKQQKIIGLYNNNKKFLHFRTQNIILYIIFNNPLSTNVLTSHS